MKHTHPYTHIPAARGYPAFCYRKNQGLRKQIHSESEFDFECSQGGAGHATVLLSFSQLLWNGTRVSVLGLRDSSQVLVSTVYKPSISWFGRRLPKSAKILVSQSLANFLYSARNEINSKRTRKHRIRHSKRLCVVHTEQITDCLNWKGPWAALAHPP